MIKQINQMKPWKVILFNSRNFIDYKKVDELAPNNKDVIRRKLELQKKVDELNEKRKTEVLTGLKDLGNTILNKFGLSLDNFKMEQN